MPTPGAINAHLTLSPNAKTLFPATLLFASSSASNKTTIKFPSKWSHHHHLLHLLLVKCSSENTESSGLKSALSNIVDQKVEELLNKEENRELLDRLNKASERVEMARKELAEIEKQEFEAKRMRDYIEQMEGRAAEIAECQREVLEARAMVEEAERSLSMNMDGIGVEDASMGKDGDQVDRDEERWESVKAAVISALVGSLAGLPLSLARATSSSQLLLPLAITFASCALFGVTFRYTVRRDLDNIQLKTGTSAAFGFVKGLATLNGGPPLELNTASFSSHALDGILFVSQDLFVFVFAAVSLDFCFKMRVLSPFPIRKSAETNAR